MGRAVMPSDVEPEDLFARREWARAGGGIGPGGWPVVTARLAGWGCMIGKGFQLAKERPESLFNFVVVILSLLHLDAR